MFFLLKKHNVLNLCIILLIILSIILCGRLALHYFSMVSATNNVEKSGSGEDSEETEEYIKWVDFNITYEALVKAAQLDIESYGDKVHLNWIEMLAYLAAKNGNNFKGYKAAQLDEVARQLQEGKSIEDLTKNMEYYPYYYEAYSAALSGLIGEYEVQVNQKPEDETQGAETEIKSETVKQRAETETEIKSETVKQGAGAETEIKSKAPKRVLKPESKSDAEQWERKYGVKGFSPIAKTFPYSHYDDFGNSRSYGFSRPHMGNDLMGQVGTPVVAVEGGRVEAMGWNQYGGWRLGIRSKDSKRYYYYAHLRQNYPYKLGLKEGDEVQAGDVIGYMGRTGYSTKENVNNIETPHLHFGMQLIFDESQKECNSEIWIDVYPIVRFLDKYRSEVVRNPENKDYSRALKTRAVTE